MKEIVCVKLENEMDLILAHKRAMKLCELNGFSLITQTTVATAVSEIARCAIEFGKNAEMILGIESVIGKKYIKALIRDTIDFTSHCMDATKYAKRLVHDIDIIRNPKEIQIVLRQELNFQYTLTEAKLESFVDYFKREPPLSAYDELRRKNLMLQDLSEKIQKREQDFHVLTDSMPLMMFSANGRSQISYCNKWLQDFLGALPKELASSSWKKFIEPDDYPGFSKDLNAALVSQTSISGQYRFKNKNSESYLWHIFSLLPLKDDKQVITQWIGFIVDINAQKQVEQTLKDNQKLRERQDELFESQNELAQRVVQLNRSNYELEQFAHLASHDLQEPLRKLFFYSDVLKRKYAEKIDEAGVNTIDNMGKAAARMKELINDLLGYSQLQKQHLPFEQVDLNSLVHDIIKDLDLTIKEKKAVVESNTLPSIEGNKLRLRQLFLNLISNALKYTKKEVPPHIQITGSSVNHHVSITVKDNGIGFDEQYKEKIFDLFERLHTRDEFPGTGIGLSICKRIAELHHGTISAISSPGEYSIFEVTMPIKQEESSVA
jgi:PAS domain S-box-containing protein